MFFELKEDDPEVSKRQNLRFAADHYFPIEDEWVDKVNERLGYLNSCWRLIEIEQFSFKREIKWSSINDEHIVFDRRNHFHLLFQQFMLEDLVNGNTEINI